jgi:dihydroorotase
MKQNWFIKKARVLAPYSSFHQQEVDVLIENGVISAIGNSLESPSDNYQIIDASGQYLAPGFFDLHVNLGEPGLEHKETIESGAKAAIAGGFTGIAVQPNTQPSLSRRAEVALIVQKSLQQPVSIYPIGSVSKNREGQSLAELYDMQQAGAIAFSDGDRSIQHAGLMSRALLYSKGINGLIMSHPEDASLSEGAKMNEGVVSTYLGMRGNPNLAESLHVSRDLFLAEYHDSRIHFSTISTKESVQLIRDAKAKGIQVTCDVAVHHLVWTDEKVMSFDSHFKVSPPLRTEEDRLALLTGLRDGTIDAIVSQHTPHEVELKKVEFHIAYPGIIGLQTALPLALEAGLEPEEIVKLMSIHPRQLLGLEQPSLAPHADADFILLDPNASWTYDDQNNYSLSKNSPLLGQSLQGRVTFAIHNHQIYRA